MNSFVRYVACEQAFGRAGWEEGKAKRALSPPFPSLSSLFFPKQRACSQARRYGAGYGEFKNPASVCTDGEAHVIVLDLDNHRVQVLTRDGLPTYKVSILCATRHLVIKDMVSTLPNP